MKRLARKLGKKKKTGRGTDLSASLIDDERDESMGSHEKNENEADVVPCDPDLGNTADNTLINELEAPDVTHDQVTRSPTTYECENDCGFRGAFVEVEKHEATCGRKGAAGTLPSNTYLTDDINDGDDEEQLKGQDSQDSCSCGVPFETSDMFCVCCGQKRADVKDDTSTGSIADTKDDIFDEEITDKDVVEVEKHEGTCGSKGAAGTLPLNTYLTDDSNDGEDEEQPEGQDADDVPAVLHSCSCGVPFETSDMFCVCCGQKRADTKDDTSTGSIADTKDDIFDDDGDEIKDNDGPAKTKLRQLTVVKAALCPKSLFCVFCGKKHDSSDATFCNYCGQDRNDSVVSLLYGGQGQGHGPTSKSSSRKWNAPGMALSNADAACSSCSCVGQQLLGESSAWTSCTCAFAGQMYGCHCQPNMLLAPQEQEKLDFDGPCCESDQIRNCVTKITLLSILIWASFVLSLAAFSTPAWAYFSVSSVLEIGVCSCYYSLLLITCVYSAYRPCSIPLSRHHHRFPL
jgi:hypothetical protein